MPKKVINPVVRKLADRLSAKHATILDIGCGTGDHVRFLADQGHQVVGIDTDPAAIDMAKQLGAAGCTFMLTDARRLGQEFAGQQFDAVVTVNTLHLLEKPAAVGVIVHAKRLVKPLGLHAISGYMIDPAQASERNRDHMFHPGELNRYYACDDAWQVESYDEEPYRARLHRGEERVFSRAFVVAQKLPCADYLPQSPDMN